MIIDLICSRCLEKSQLLGGGVGTGVPRPRPYSSICFPALLSGSKQLELVTGAGAGDRRSGEGRRAAGLENWRSWDLPAS